MIVEDERDIFSGNINVDYDYVDSNISNVKISCDFATYLQTRRVMPEDLVEHI